MDDGTWRLPGMGTGLTKTPIKDVRTSTCGPELGYAGCFMQSASAAQSPNEKYWFEEHADETARALKEAGAWLQRMWNANAWFARRVPDANPDVKKRYAQTHPDVAFRFWKANGIRLLFTLEAWGGERSKREILEFVRWIVDNDCKDVTHVIYHFYGANAAYGCSASGFERIKNFAKVYPEIADKKVWITEWRERSDEDNRCHQMFFSALWKAHYLLTVLTRPEVDAVNNHCIASLSGGLYVSNGRTWCVQWDEKCRDYPDVSGIGRPHMELGPSGPLFRLYCDALAGHPVILSSGANGHCGRRKGKDGKPTDLFCGVWASALYYDGLEKGAQWVAACDPAKRSFTLLCANSNDEPRTYVVELKGAKAGATARVRSVSCPTDKVRLHAKAGEPKPWTLVDREEPVKATESGFEFLVPANSYLTYTVGPASGPRPAISSERSGG